MELALLASGLLAEAAVVGVPSAVAGHNEAAERRPAARRGDRVSIDWAVLGDLVAERVADS